MPDNVGYIYCESCKRYYIDVFYIPHKKICKYLWDIPIKKFVLEY